MRFCEDDDEVDPTPSQLERKSICIQFIEFNWYICLIEKWSEVINEKWAHVRNRRDATRRRVGISFVISISFHIFFSSLKYTLGRCVVYVCVNITVLTFEPSRLRLPVWVFVCTYNHNAKYAHVCTWYVYATAMHIAYSSYKYLHMKMHLLHRSLLTRTNKPIKSVYFPSCLPTVLPIYLQIE